MSVIFLPDIPERAARVEDARNFPKHRRRQWSLFHSAKRHAAKLHRTPAWSDLNAIWLIYVEAYGKTRKTGIAHHVDHFYPLQGELVSGLHVPANLRIITATANLKKGNKYEIL